MPDSFSITLFLAPTAARARAAAWNLAGETTTPLDPSLVFCDASSAASWRDLAREGALKTRIAPRLIRAEAFFSRFHGANARQRALSGADRLWVLSEVARRVAPQLEVLGKHAPSRDFLSGFAHWIAALRRANFAEFPTSPDSDELNLLLRAYDAHLKSLNAFDVEAAPALFPLSAARNQAFSWPRTLVVDDLLDPSPALQIGLDSLLLRAERVFATLVCPGAVEAENPALTGALRFWRERGAKMVRVGEENLKSPVAARFLIAAQFLGAATGSSTPENVLLTPAHTPWDEMNRIAAQIRREIEAGARPDDFALAVADFGAGEAVARRAFASHGVPMNWPQEPSLRQSPLVRALLRAASTCKSALSVHEMHDLFGDGTLQLQLETQVFSARRLRAAGLAARHSDLSDLAATRAAYEAKIARFSAFPKNDEAPRRASIEAALVSGDLEMVAQFQSLCAHLAGRLSASVWQNRMGELIQTLAGHWLEAEDEASRVACATLERLRTAIECVAERSRGWSDSDSDNESESEYDGENEAARDAGDWLSWLEWEIDEAPRQPDSSVRVACGVRVGRASAPPAARRATFFCGLSEGVWPNSTPLGPLGARGRALNHVLRAHEAAPIARAAHVLARSLGENETVSLSYANFVGGAETPPSPLIDDLKAAFPRLVTWPQLPETGEEDATRRALLARWNLWLEAQELDPQDEAIAPLQTLKTLRSQRREAASLGVYDGVLGSRGRALMQEWNALHGATALSVSALELYARCPLRFFFERILQVEAEDEPEDDLDARAAGNLVHAIAHHFLKSCQAPLSGADFASALENLSQWARTECAQLPIRPILREAEFFRLMGADGQSGPLAKWLQLEIAAGRGAWTGEMTPLLQSGRELNGAGTGLEVRFEFDLGGERVKGFIDRLDIAPDGSRLAVLDYKTGDPAGFPSWRHGDRGLHFQLAIYALAARSLSRHLNHPPRVAMAYLSLRKARITHGIGQEGTLGKGHSSGKSLADDRFEAWLGDVGARAQRIADLQRGGVFNIALQSATDARCDTCASKTLCAQHEATQVARLEAHRGSPFVYLPEVWEWEAEQNAPST